MLLYQIEDTEHMSHRVNSTVRLSLTEIFVLICIVSDLVMSSVMHCALKCAVQYLQILKRNNVSALQELLFQNPSFKEFKIISTIYCSLCRSIHRNVSATRFRCN